MASCYFVHCTLPTRVNLQSRNFVSTATSSRLTRELSQPYKVQVLPKLNYCCCVWDPATSTLTDQLESVEIHCQIVYEALVRPLRLKSELVHTLHAGLGWKPSCVGRSSWRNQSFHLYLISLPLLISTLGLIITIQFVYRLQGPPHSSHHFLFLPVICGSLPGHVSLSSSRSFKAAWAASTLF